MDGSLDQLMRLLSNRGLEWLRQRIMALPDPVPVDHPDLAALAQIGQVAPILSGLRGSISPLEVIVARRLTPALVQAAARQVVAGARGPGAVALMLAGGLVAPDDPLWHLACEALAEDASLPLPQRLALSADPDLIASAERVVTTLPATITAAHVDLVAQVLGQLYRHGARRPVLSSARAFTAIFDHLTRLADWADGQADTAAVAQVAFCLRLMDPDCLIADRMGDLIAVQRPDGSFPARMGFGQADQTLAQAVRPTLLTAMALHMAAWGRWRGPAPVWLHPRPLPLAMAALAGRIAALPPAPDDRLRAASLLTCATGTAWLARLDAPRQAGPALAADLARICFCDPVAARHLRGWLMPDPGRAQTSPRQTVEAAWLSGAPVSLTPMPPALLALWDRAARRGGGADGGTDGGAAFLHCARLACHHAVTALTPAIRHALRQHVARAIDARDDDLLGHLETLVTLSRLLPTQDAAQVAA